MKFEVTYTHVIERQITAHVEAENEEEAIEKAMEGDTTHSDEDDCPEQGIEIKDIEISEVKE